MKIQFGMLRLARKSVYFVDLGHPVPKRRTEKRPWILTQHGATALQTIKFDFPTALPSFPPPFFGIARNGNKGGESLLLFLDDDDGPYKYRTHTTT